MNDALININGGDVTTLEIILLLTMISLIPSLLIMVTSFTRIIIVLSIFRNALGLQQTPPNMVLISIAIFLSIFIMGPVIDDINQDAYQPYKAQLITQEEALAAAQVPVKEFMLKQTKADSLNLFLEFAEIPPPETHEGLLELPLRIVIPSFMASELARAFIMGFLLYIPFLVIDVIVASTLMSMGMIMLPPVMISLPFKILLFVVVNGWDLLFMTIVKSFN
ncbi:MAG: flagellar type III secretion system pore protein FliP [Clostridiales bacterium]|nr:flagellar type III secretion system pore protein FliP [Clostridiales bacterium]